MNMIQLPSTDDDETKPELKVQPDRKGPNRGSGGSKDPKRKYQHRFSYKSPFFLGLVMGVVAVSALVMLVPARWLVSVRNDLSQAIATPYDPDGEKVRADAMLGDFQAIGQLATVDYEYRGVGDTGTSTAKIFNISVPFTESRLLVTYDGRILAGVDLAKMTEDDIVQDGTSVTVTIPAAGIMSNEIDDKSVVTVLEQESVFNQLDEDARNSYRASWKTQMQDTAIANGVLDKAEENAKALIKEYLEQALPDDYTVNVMTQSEAKAAAAKAAAEAQGSGSAADGSAA